MSGYPTRRSVANTIPSATRVMPRVRSEPPVLSWVLQSPVATDTRARAAIRRTTATESATQTPTDDLPDTVCHPILLAAARVGKGRAEMEDNRAHVG